MVNSEFHDYHADFRRDSLAGAYVRDGKAKNWNEAQSMAEAEMFNDQTQEKNQEWAERARAEKEAQRQEPIQEALRDVDLSGTDSF